MKKITVLCALLLISFFWGIIGLKNQTVKERAQNENMQKQDQTEVSENVQMRVLIKSDDYASEYHDEICLYSDADYEIASGSENIKYKAGQETRLDLQNALFENGDTIQVTAEHGAFYFPELKRAEEKIGYEGSLEIRKTEQGLLLINCLPLEAYLCGVLPGEMPGSYPMEALKAQAICARTYALQQKEEQRAKAYGADLDDSTSYQVYNNRRHMDKTDQAVQETAGLVMKNGASYVDARYYSTSCGLDLHMDLSQDSVFAGFIQGTQMDSAESEEPFFRWKTSISLNGFQGKEGWERVENLEIEKRNEKGAVTELEVSGQKNGAERSETIEGEYQIRKFLALSDPVIELQDGSTREGWQLLPSAFFIWNTIMEEEKVTEYEILGGGYGHGEGMSQNGAKQMAVRGESYEEILKQYFGEIEISQDAGIAK